MRAKYLLFLRAVLAETLLLQSLYAPELTLSRWWLGGLPRLRGHALPRDRGGLPALLPAAPLPAPDHRLLQHRGGGSRPAGPARDGGRLRAPARRPGAPLPGGRGAVA